MRGVRQCLQARTPHPRGQGSLEDGEASCQCGFMAVHAQLTGLALNAEVYKVSSLDMSLHPLAHIQICMVCPLKPFHRAIEGCKCFRLTPLGLGGVARLSLARAARLDLGRSMWTPKRVKKRRRIDQGLVSPILVPKALFLLGQPPEYP